MRAAALFLSLAVFLGAADAPRIIGNNWETRLLRKVQPNYPPLALRYRIQGIVRFNAIIGTNGRVQTLQLVTGHPLLVAAAQKAVKQWVYRPAYVRGEPAEVVTQIDVKFNIDEWRRSVEESPPETSVRI